MTVQWLRALPALFEDSDSTPITYMAAHNLLELLSQDF